MEHPLLREPLGETLGVIIFQDQVLQVCQAVAGQAEALRRAMSRRRSRELLEGFWEEFRDGAAAFGLLAYQSAWLMHYHPLEFYTALFNNQPMGFYSLDALGRDAARHAIEIDLPDVNLSS